MGLFGSLIDGIFRGFGMGAGWRVGSEVAETVVDAVKGSNKVNNVEIISPAASQQTQDNSAVPGANIAKEASQVDQPQTNGGK